MLIVQSGQREYVYNEKNNDNVIEIRENGMVIDSIESSTTLNSYNDLLSEVITLKLTDKL